MKVKNTIKYTKILELILQTHSTNSSYKPSFILYKQGLNF